MLATLERLNTDRGVAVVVVTHDLEVAAMARRRIALRDGLVESDSGAVSAVRGRSGRAPYDAPEPTE